MTPSPSVHEHVPLLFRNGRLWMNCREYIYHCAANSVCQAAMAHTDLAGRYFRELGIVKQKPQSEAWMGFSKHHYFWLLSVFIPRKGTLILPDVEKLFLTAGLQRDAPLQLLLPRATSYSINPGLFLVKFNLIFNFTEYLMSSCARFLWWCYLLILRWQDKNVT